MTDEDKIHAAEEPSDQIELDTSSYLDSPFLHDDIVGLIRKQEWRIRKLVVHDFSGHDEYTLRTTMDVDTEWISEHLLLGNSRDPLAIPMDWRPKRQVLALDARASTGGSAHIIRRSRNEAVDRYLMAEAITGAQPSEDHQDNQELPKCITLLISQLVDEDLDSASTSIYDLLESTQERIKGLAPHGLFTSECTATQCDGQEIWDNAMRNSRALSQIALLTAGYIRSVVVERPSRNTPVVIIKTSEVPAASPFDIHPPARSNSTFVQFILRRCRYLALGQWVVRKTLSLPFPGDAGLIKCKAPSGTRLLPTRASHGTENIPEMQVTQQGDWAYHKPSRGTPEEVLQMCTTEVDVVARRGHLLLPGFALLLLCLVVQFALIWSMLTRSPRDDLFVQWITAFGAAIPALALAYVARISSHPFLTVLTDKYRVLLALGMVVQLVSWGIVVTRMREGASPLAVSFIITALIAAMFLDALVQPWHFWHQWRMNLLTNEVWLALAAMLLASGALFAVGGQNLGMGWRLGVTASSTLNYILDGAGRAALIGILFYLSVSSFVGFLWASRLNHRSRRIHLLPSSEGTPL